ncbi:MAG: hypothetical protein NVV63_12525 [Opitutus sp.]|nr:hypothetical protein [Opitutus sp.]
MLIPGELDGEGNMVRAAQKLQLEPDLYSWFGLSDDLVTSLPAELVPIVLRHYLITAARADETFPDRWKENVIEVKRVVAGFRGQATQHEFTHQLRLHPGRRYDPVLDYHVARMEREAERQAALDEAAQSNSYVSTAFDRWAAGDPV